MPWRMPGLHAVHYRWQGQTLYLRCHIQPKARANEVCRLHRERLKLRLIEEA